MEPLEVANVCVDFIVNVVGNLFFEIGKTSRIDELKFIDKFIDIPQNKHNGVIN